jgi:hypothetical protein
MYLHAWKENARGRGYDAHGKCTKISGGGNNGLEGGV